MMILACPPLEFASIRALKPPDQVQEPTRVNCFFLGKFGSNMGLDSRPYKSNAPFKARSPFWMQLPFPTPIQCFSDKKRLGSESTSSAKAFRTTAHVGDFLALGSPVGQGHHLALQVKAVDLSARTATSKCFCSDRTPGMLEKIERKNCRQPTAIAKIFTHNSHRK